MKISELIEHLHSVNALPDYGDVYLWVDGNRYAISDVDISCYEDGDYIDINADVGERR
jgi:hypothetical protein